MTTAVTTQHQQATSLQASPNINVGLTSFQGFELVQRAANLLSRSTLVPAAYRQRIEKKDRSGSLVVEENHSALANCVVALNMAQRMGADPLMVMQNLYIVEGRPSWSSQWIIAAINGCGRFSPLRFDIKNNGRKDVEYAETFWENRQKQTRTIKVNIEDKVCTAWAIENETGARIESPPVSIEMAVKEGWYTKNGSKWKTMDEVMLRYRTASFFGKLYAPELLMGIQSAEELQDYVREEPHHDNGVDTSVVRPTRTEQAEPEPSGAIIDAEAEEVSDVAPDAFEWVSPDGDVTELSPTDWVDRWLSAIADTTDGDILVGLWDSNSSQLQRLRDLGLEAPAEEIATAHTAKADALAATERQKREKQQAYINNCLKEIEGCQSVEALDRWQDERATALRRMSDLQYAPVGAAIESRMAFLREQAATE